jgi:hypothetical protein
MILSPIEGLYRCFRHYIGVLEPKSVTKSLYRCFKLYIGVLEPRTFPKKLRRYFRSYNNDIKSQTVPKVLHRRFKGFIFKEIRRCLTASGGGRPVVRTGRGSDWVLNSFSCGAFCVDSIAPRTAQCSMLDPHSRGPQHLGNDLGPVIEDVLQFLFYKKLGDIAKRLERQAIADLVLYQG